MQLQFLLRLPGAVVKLEKETSVVELGSFGGTAGSTPPAWACRITRGSLQVARGQKGEVAALLLRPVTCSCSWLLDARLCANAESLLHVLQAQAPGCPLSLDYQQNSGRSPDEGSFA